MERIEIKTRFVLIENNPEFPDNGETRWYWDTARPLPAGEKQPYIAVQCYADRDPNNFIPIKNLRLLYTDEAEYYAVCPACYSANAALQWSGSTRDSNWHKKSEAFLEKHQQEKGWCEFCDPIFGNGGWI